MRNDEWKTKRHWRKDKSFCAENYSAIYGKGKPEIYHEPCDELEMGDIAHKPCGVLNDSILVFEKRPTAFNRIKYE